MKNIAELLRSVSDKPIPPLDLAIPLSDYTPLDLSTTNPDLKTIDSTDPIECQEYIDRILTRNNATVAYGGYLEKRNLYNDKIGFSKGSPRNIHLGIDFWAEAGTKVLVPVAGKIHSFQNNATSGDYGPTIILEHRLGKVTFYSLYGHLSLESLYGLQKRKAFRAGELLATLGTPDINVDYAPHLHFQLILDMEGKKGDYPGVCSAEDLEFYSKNCPNPNLLLGF
ncbi:peptidoglycan DD-metalloendopeptidase family protein [Flavobacteriaceae bacterium TP-CH-4]|uniref:Peptidoglycan DD-metalloendopeptidase family protein n=1 Tax=Pelagihabitans pacificus TaxID=2696054 RepID=A0A967AP85_9FLAO|nr:peptidoglycan DD-metalloendopeptidase family protein [Pelagihabitans pacificus]NHF57818.1 peptidoglycan DD-metalloendopeptidase family protein [Pelagihabitans pacificus]